MIPFGSHILQLQERSSPRRVELHRLELNRPPFEIFLHLQSRYQYAYLLESVVGPRMLAEYSFIGFEPEIVVVAEDGSLRATRTSDGEEESVETRDPLLELQGLLQPLPTEHPFRLMGGGVGFISYDYIRYLERLPETRPESGTPDLEFGLYKDGIVFDHKRKRSYYYTLGEDRSEEIREVADGGEEPRSFQYTQPRVNITQPRYEEMVVKAKEYIRSGDIFQAVLSKRYEFDLQGDPLSFYQRLRRINPSPYMFYLKMGERRIIGSSPEMLVRVKDRRVETFPIAGSRPRTGDHTLDEALSRELLSDPKERAEHIMLVDLARNDLGKISEFGSVRVKEFMEVHRFSHVQHIVSHVAGSLRKGFNSFDTFRAVFPAGTVTGAPKVRAMEIIDELEPVRRGPYAGAVGYFSYSSDADFAITIRTLVVEGSQASIQVGAGIVADSVPEREWFETEHKARALLAALNGEE